MVIRARCRQSYTAFDRGTKHNRHGPSSSNMNTLALRLLRLLRSRLGLLHLPIHDLGALPLLRHRCRWHPIPSRFRPIRFRLLRRITRRWIHRRLLRRRRTRMGRRNRIRRSPRVCVIRIRWIPSRMHVILHHGLPVHRHGHARPTTLVRMPRMSWRWRRRCNRLTVSIEWRHISRRVIIRIALRCGELGDGVDRRCRGSDRSRWRSRRLAVGLLCPVAFLSRVWISCCKTIMRNCTGRGVDTYSLMGTRLSWVCSYVCMDHASTLSFSPCAGHQRKSPRCRISCIAHKDGVHRIVYTRTRN